MMHQLFSPAHRRRATSLIFVIVMLPLALVLMTSMFGELQLRHYELKRNELRVQSRLLAESALALASTLTTLPAEPVEGKIDGAGQYRLERKTRPDGKSAVVASGVAGTSNYRIITEYEALAQPGGGFVIIDTRRRAEANGVKGGW